MMPCSKMTSFYLPQHSKNEVDDIDLVWKYLHDVEEVQLDGNRCFVATEPVEQHVEDDACAQDEGASDCLTPEVEAPVTDDVKLCGLKRALEEAPEDAEAESSDDAIDSSPDEPLKKKKRGEHVKGRREMQETAREGQKHWATKVVELRDEWEKKNVGRLNKQYVWQLRMCERLRVKPQRECILLALQIATVDGLIMPFPFIDSKHSLGWSGFQVKKDQSGEFRKRITDMFTNQCKGTTINNTFRRAGLVAEGNWERAWRGLSPFVYPHWQNAT